MENKQVIEIIYKGFEISYNEDRESYTSLVDEKSYEKQSLKLCKKKIDELVKKESAIEPVEAYFAKYGDITGIKKVLVLSLAGRSSYSGNKEYWIKDSDNRRTKESSENLFEINGENEEKIKKINLKDKEIEKIRKEKNELQKSLKRISF